MHFAFDFWNRANRCFSWIGCWFFVSGLLLSAPAFAYKYVYVPSQTSNNSVTIAIQWGQFESVIHLKEYKNGQFTRNIPFTYGQNSTAGALTEAVYRYEIGVKLPDEYGSPSAATESSSIEVLFNPPNPSTATINKTNANLGDAVTITWSGVGAADYYEIDRSVDGVAWENIATVDDANPHSYTASLLHSGKSRYRVRACKNSIYSSKFACGNGTATSEIEVFSGIEFDVDSYGYRVFSGDFNADGYTDYYFYSKKRILILHGEIATPITLPPNPTFSIYGSEVASWSPWAHYLKFESLPDYLLQELNQLKEGVDYFIGDFDGDGKLDFLFRGQSAQEIPFIVYGNGQFSQPKSVKDFQSGSELALLISNRSKSFYIKDVNKDGADDLVLKSGSSFVADTAYVSSAGVPITKTELTEPETKYANLAGKTAGKASVSASGAASYFIPIELPQGSGGHTPQLALNYSSQGSNGLMGAGWNLSGLSAIRHCRRTLVHDGATSATKDRFCLDGQRLMVVQGNYGDVGSVYKTEIDSFKTVTAVDGSAGTPGHFLVESKDGKVAKYQFSGQDFYPLSEVRDSTGKNLIRYNYEYADGNGFRIGSIEYAFGTGATANALIKFIYEGRPDYIPHNLLIGAYDLKQRISRIEVTNNVSESRTYHIQYLKSRASSVNAPVSRVSSIQECVSSACLAPITFDWNINEQSGFSANYYIETAFESDADEFKEGRVADLNGDGLADYVYFHKDSGDNIHFRTALSDGQKWVKNTFSQHVGSSGQKLWLLADYNGDGQLDLVHGTDQGWLVRLFDGQGFAGGTIDLGIPATNSSQALLQDITGDGLPDLIVRKEDKSGLDVYYAKKKASGGFEYASPASKQFLFPVWLPDSDTEIGDIRAFRLQDKDGDGRAELLIPVKVGCASSCTGMEWREVTAGGIGSYGMAMGIADHTQHSGEFDFLPADLNQDGKSDLVFKDHNDNWSYFIRGVGSETSRISLSGVTGDKTQLVDFNHDGYLDIVWPTSVLNVKLWNGTGFGGTIVTGIPASSSDSYTLEFADINGDGFQEYVFIRDTSETHWVHYFAPLASTMANGVVSKITNAYGDESSFTYKALTDASGVYTKGQNAGGLNWGQPVFDITGSLYVVSKHQFSMPVAANANNKEEVSYSYKNLRVQGGGRGSLGFAEMTETDSRAGKKVTTFAQQFPYTGMVTKLAQYTPQGKLLFTLDNTLNQRAGWPYVDISTEQHRLLKSNGTVEGPIYKTVVTDSDYDDYGNLELSTTITKNASNQEVSKVVQDNNFVGATCNREKGRICSTKITTTRGGVSQTREVAFEYYPAGDAKSGLLKAEKIEPNYNGADKAQIQLTTSYTYDDYGNRLTTTKTAANEPNRIATSVYDDPQKRYIDITRDADNRLQTEVVARNTLGQPTEVRTYLDVSGSSYVTTDIVYDVLGRETFRDESSAPWVKTEYRNCTSCNVAGAKTYTVVTSEAGAKVTNYFDALGRKIHERKLGFDSSDSIETSFEYDDLGRLERQSEPYQTGSSPLYWTKNNYDILSRISSIQHPDGNSTTYVEPVLEGNYIVSTTTNPNGQNRKEKMSALGELVFVEDHHGGKLEYLYDPLGNVTDTISHGRAGENLGITISVSYDQRGRKTAMSDPDKGSWSYQYNGFGDLIEQIDGNDQKVVTQYDKYGRPLRRTDYLDLTSGAVENHTRWYYDDKEAGGASVPYALGKVTSVIMSESPVDEICYAATTQYCGFYKYNSSGLQKDATTVLGVDGADGYFYSETAYDGLGRPQIQYDVLNGVVKNGGNSIASGIQEYYTDTGHLRYVRDLNTNKELYRILDTNPRGQITDFDINSGTVRVDHNFDAATGRLMSQKADKTAVADTMQQLAYTWDKIGNFTSRHNQRTDKKESFCYDHLNRLLQVNANTLSTAGCNPMATGTQYQYDSIGNIKKKDGVDYAYGGSKPHAATSVGGITYTYGDNNGNLTSDGTGRSFSYTSFDKPTLIQNTTSNDSAAFSYGPDRSRYKRVDTRSNGEAVTTLYLGSVERIHKQSTNSYEWKRYLPGGAVYTYKTDAAFNQQSLIQRYLLKDHIGSTDVVLDGNGAPVQAAEMSFNPWGQRRDINWQELEIADLIGNGYSLLTTYNDVTTKGFTGHEMVDALGIIHMNGRIYDPHLGRFLQADPFIDGVKDTQGYNRYSYVANNPLTAVDPSGYSKFDDWGDDLSDTWASAKEWFKDACGSYCEVGVNSNGDISLKAGQFNPEHDGYWAQPGAAGASGPEGVAPGAFGNGDGYLAYIPDSASIRSRANGGGFNAVLSGETSQFIADAFEQSEFITHDSLSSQLAEAGEFKTVQLSIGVTSALDLRDFAEELKSQMQLDLKFLQSSFAKSSVGNSSIDNNDHAVAALHILSYLKGKDFLRNPSISNNFELTGYFAKARANLMNEMAPEYLGTLANKFGDLQFSYATGGGRLAPQNLFKQQIKNIVYHHNDTSELRRKIYDEVIDVVESGVTRL